jgi:hypothetical protein
MERKELVGSDGEMPNYVTPLSTVSCDVIHANVMNVFFSPKDIMRVLPTEPNDTSKVNKISIFGNWSAENELDIFKAWDRLDSHSTKIGECPYMVSWKKDYGVEIKRTVKVDLEGKEIYDEDTGEILYEETEEPKLLYNAPVLEILSRKDYIFPSDSLIGVKPPWEARIIRMNYDDVYKDTLSGKMYGTSLNEIKGWDGEETTEFSKQDYDGNELTTNPWEKEFLEWFGSMRVNMIKYDTVIDEAKIEELEDEFIAIVHIKSRTLCALRKNKFPLKMRPIDLDFFIPDDTGLRKGIGVIKFMESLQKAYDALFNQYVLGTLFYRFISEHFSSYIEAGDESIKYAALSDEIISKEIQVL